MAFCPRQSDAHDGVDGPVGGWRSLVSVTISVTSIDLTLRGSSRVDLMRESVYDTTYGLGKVT